ncbi:murein biosynthesis integral membrane protein MurJ [Candidatus Trichorickettsia mobilis]|uniref:murein biosynthesis integral membrane protein MurJ n=1 Tax=Candidatus Trichorickettsia mobilis TaxID=1346319 RepID=UPI002B25D99A|nr:murein biosynthesis integral membrane protein MurJ [Candidatus Trichorickettsia mobilis]
MHLVLFRSGIIVAFFTLLSRIFGLARELFIASMFGTSYLADSINVAFKLPNLFRRIFGEGALSAVFIPIFNEKLLHSSAAARKISGEIFTLLLLTLITLVVLMEIFMPSIVLILAPGFHKNLEKFELTILVCRITIPYVIFISATALLGGILNSVKQFAAFAFAPIILSVTVIIGTLILQQYISSPIAISIAVVIAGILQILFMLYFVFKANLSFPLTINIHDSDVKKFLLNMIPATLSSGVYQLNLFISQSIASFIPGAVSILSYADRIYQFPLSIIGITFGTILLPELSKIYKINDLKKAYQLQNKAIKAGLFLSIPASLGIILLSEPIIHIIFERGAFLADDTIKTAQAISAFAIGLPAFVLSKIFMPIFYANNDTKTPLKITIYSLTINTILNLLLMLFFDHIGIALGSSIAAWYNVWLLHKYGKVYHVVPFTSKKIMIFTLKLLFSALSMSLIILIINHYYGSYFYHESLLIKSLTLSATIITGALVFFISSLILGIYQELLSKNESTI